MTGRRSRHAAETLEEFGVPYERQVVSAHRTPELMFDFARSAADEGFSAIIAGAGGAAHLPGMVAALTPLPVLGVPVQSRDAVAASTRCSPSCRLPAGVPTATFAIGLRAATNAALFAIRMLAVNDASLRVKLAAYREEQAQHARSSTATLASPPRAARTRPGQKPRRNKR